MAIALHAKSLDGLSDLYVPVWTQSEFVAQWLPACRLLSLEVVPMMETPGVVLASTDEGEVTLGAAELLPELRRLGSAVEGRGDQALLPRLSRLIEALEALDPSRYRRVHLG